MGVIPEGILRGCQGLFTPVSLGYPLSVFNKNSTLEPKTKKKCKMCVSPQLGSGDVCFWTLPDSFDSVRRFQATLLLRTTCMCLCCNGVASCVAT